MAGLNFAAQIAASEMLDKTCPECNRLWAEYSEVIQKTFRLEERLSRARLHQDHEQVTALAERLASLADSQTRLGQELTEHVGRAHSPQQRDQPPPVEL